MKRTKQTGMDMVSGSMWNKILLFALPLAAGSMLQQLFNSVDAAVVGRFASSEALAAVGANTSVVSLFINLFVGISVGSNVVIANNIGKGERERIPDVVHTTMLLAIVSGLLLLVAGICVARPLLQLLSTPENVLDLAVVYLRLYCLGMPFIMTYNFAAAILRSKGDTKRPLYCLILSGCCDVYQSELWRGKGGAMQARVPHLYALRRLRLFGVRCIFLSGTRIVDRFLYNGCGDGGLCGTENADCAAVSVPCVFL